MDTQPSLRGPVLTGEAVPKTLTGSTLRAGPQQRGSVLGRVGLCASPSLPAPSFSQHPLVPLSLGGGVHDPEGPRHPWNENRVESVVHFSERAIRRSSHRGLRTAREPRGEGVSDLVQTLNFITTRHTAHYRTWCLMVLWFHLLLLS